MISKVLVTLACLATVKAGFLHQPTHSIPLESHQHVPIFHGAVHQVPVHHAPIEHHLPVVALPAPTEHIIGVEKTIVKQVHVPYPVDRYVKVDRHIHVPVDRYVKVDRPVEVIKYVEQPYIVRVPKPYHVPIVTNVAVPQPIVQVEPIITPDHHIHNEVQHLAAHQPNLELHTHAPSGPVAHPSEPLAAPHNEYLPSSH